MRKTVTPDPIARSWSGGKDSALALGELLCDPALRAVALVTTINARLRRVSIHGVRRALLHARDSSRSPADSSRESDHVLHAASRWQRRRHIDTDVRDL